MTADEVLAALDFPVPYNGPKAPMSKADVERLCAELDQLRIDGGQPTCINHPDRTATYQGDRYGPYLCGECLLALTGRDASSWGGYEPLTDNPTCRREARLSVRPVIGTEE